MNIVFDPWIPVIDHLGEPLMLSLYDVFARGEEFNDLAVRSHERVSLMRLFLCVVYAALCGPKNYDEWCEVPNQYGKVLKYLEKWSDSFELYHEEKPWLQVAGLSGKGLKSLDKLCLTQASGVRSTWYTHAVNNTYTDAEIALNLLTFQNFFVAGGKASSFFWGDTEIKKPSNPKGGPCSGSSILFTFLRGRDLKETIHLNMISYDELQFVYGESSNWLGKPLWERPIQSFDDKDSIKNATETHLGRLVPQTRILHIYEDHKSVLFGSGFEYPKFQDPKTSFYPDVYATVVLNQKKERKLLGGNSINSTWKKLPSLFVQLRDNSKECQGPLCLRNIPDGVSCAIVVCALVTDSSETAKMLDLLESIFHISSNFHTTEGCILYETEIKEAEKLEKRYKEAVKYYKKELDNGCGDQVLKPLSSNYWFSVEQALPFLMAHIKAVGTEASIPTLNVWRKKLLSSMYNAFGSSCNHTTPQQLKAFVKAKQNLFGSRERKKKMIDQSNDKESYVSNVLNQLHNHKDDRGMMANLRWILKDNGKHNAWPILHRLGIKIKDKNMSFVAGLFALHSEDTSIGNIGDTFKKIEQKRNEVRGTGKNLTPTERRFNRLLEADRDTLFSFLIESVRMAKSQGVPINYKQLSLDLKFWGERVKEDWASSFWC